MKWTTDKIISKLRQDNFAVVICFALSLVLWLVIQLSKTYEHPRTVYLEYQVPTGMALTQAPPAKLEALVKASGWKLLGSLFRTQEYRLKVDLRAYGSEIIEKEELYQMLSSELGLPVVGSNRNYLLFALDSTATRVVPVVLNNQIKLARDFFLSGPIKLSPDSITLTGPADQIAKVQAVYSVPLVAENVNHSLQTEVDLLAPEATQIQLDKKKVFVTIPVEQFTELEFSIAVNVPEETGEYILLPKTVKLQCTTRLSAARDLSESDFTVAVLQDAIGTNPNSAFVPLQLVQKPEFVRGVRLSQNAVELFLIR